MIKESIETEVLPKDGSEVELRIVKNDDAVDFILDGNIVFSMGWADNLKEVITLMSDKWD